MRKVAIAASIMVACGYAKPSLHEGNGSDAGNSSDGAIVDGAVVDAPADAGTDAAPAICNALVQTGCMSGQKCTWIVDTSTGSTSTGHIGCAPVGGVALGGACTRNPPGSTGYDNCVKGDYCFGPVGGGAGTCKQICDQAGGAPMCASNFTCQTYDGIFGPSGMPVAAGVCDPSCDPNADNNFLGSNGNNRSGSACGSAGSAAGSGSAGFIYQKGCYGIPNGQFGQTKFTCASQMNPSRVHRTVCDTANHAGDAAACAATATNVYINGCAAGYEPAFYDAEGVTQVDCMAFCAPAVCYNANCGAGLANLGGNNGSGHACKTANLQFASFTQASSTVNGEQCFYSWLFEFDASNNFVMSPTSDTVGFCLDHSKYKYDPTGGSNLSTVWPRCDQIGMGSQGAGVTAYGDASVFGCVDTTTARAFGDLTFGGKSSLKRPTELRMPYHAVMAP